MSKMSQISAKMDEQNIPEKDRNALFSKVAAGLKVAEQQIDGKTKKNVVVDTHTMMSDDELANKIKTWAEQNHCVVNTEGRNFLAAPVFQYLMNIERLYPFFDFKKGQGSVGCRCTLKNRNGFEVTQTVMSASEDEEFLADKDFHAVVGMAQTRAMCRAISNLYGHIIKMAGFTPTPYCEITKKKGDNK